VPVQAEIAEVDHQNQWQRAAIGVAVVGSSVTQVREVLGHRSLSSTLRYLNADAETANDKAAEVFSRMP